MGCTTSSANGSHGLTEETSFSLTMTRRWQVVPTVTQAKAIFTADGTIGVNSDTTQVELRTLFDYPVARQCMLDYAKALIIGDIEHFILGWADIQEFKTISASDTKTNLALSICSKYVKGNKVIEDIERDLIRVEDYSSEVFPSIFDEVQTLFFNRIHDDMFLQFKLKPEYKKMNLALRRKYNSVKCGDFDFFKILGEGGFGVVCSVRKKSTGSWYAMKLQRKDKMLEMFGDEPWRADFEKQAFASCKHPFIVELFFAFQTKSLAILVTSLCTGLDLAKTLKAGGPLSREQVLFYSAEITSALSYLHHKGFIYRDLKPGNVLLNADGHIQLVDFGAVCDVKGKTLGICSDVSAFLPVYSHQGKKPAEDQNGVEPGVQMPSYDGLSTLNGTFGELIDEDKMTTRPKEKSTSRATSNGTMAAAPPVLANGNIPEEGTRPAGTSATICDELKSMNLNSPGDSPRVRGASLIGTIGYMAPEMVLVMMNQEGWSHNGYTKAVDWWSLGVTMYKLLTGTNPFQNEFEDVNSSANTAMAFGATLEKYAVLLEDVDYSALNDSPAIVHCISKLLSVEERTRLGYGSSGSQDVASHAYFATVDWAQLEQKLATPPPLPSGCVSTESRNKLFQGVEHMFVSEGKKDWLSLGTKSADESKKLQIQRIQRQFENWDYTSPAAVIVELGHLQ